MIYIPQVQPDEIIRRSIKIHASQIPLELRKQFDQQWIEQYREPLPRDRELRLEVSIPKRAEDYYLENPAYIFKKRDL